MSFSIEELSKRWVEQKFEAFHQEPEHFLKLGQYYLKQHEPLLAYDVFIHATNVVTEADSMYGSIQYYLALSLLESGNEIAAIERLDELLRLELDNSSDIEGALGRAYKQKGLSSSDLIEATSDFKKAENIYQKAYKNARKQKRLHDSYYHGINLAFLMLCQGAQRDACELSQEVIQICEGLLEADSPYWLYATIAEASLILEDEKKATTYYSEAAKRCVKDVRSRTSMAKQASVISGLLDVDFDELFPTFALPQVIVYTGHRIDANDRSSACFPAEKMPYVKSEIRHQLGAFSSAICIGSAANGADLLFAEAALENGFDLHIVLPYNRDVFRQESVKADDDIWFELYDTVLDKAKSLIELAEFSSYSQDTIYDFANRYITGMALSRAASTMSKVKGLAVFDGVESALVGGTYSALELWKQTNIDYEVISLEVDGIYTANEFPQGEEAIFALPVVTRQKNADVSYYNYLPMLFADVKGYSKLNEEQLVNFSSVFLAKAGEIFNRHSVGILSKRTQGDGLFVVFSSVETAIDFSTSLQAMILSVDWASYELPADLSIRIALDAGPCYSYQEPITQTREYCGHYVNRAARLEPVTPPSTIFASETFVAMAQCSKKQKQKFHYMGYVVLPKQHGTMRAFQIKQY